MKLMIAGANGQLGTELRRQLAQGGCALGTIPQAFATAQIVCFDVDTLSIADQGALMAYMVEQKPDVVINCSAYTNVDGCETNQQTAYEVNTLGAGYLAAACEAVGAKLVHVSTDYVFPGTGIVPYSEYDRPGPVSVYGKTKLAGEEAAARQCRRLFIVRTAWLYGYAGKNFVKTILNAGRKSGALRVVDDQLGNPTNAEDLAYHLLLLADSEYYGIYHCTGEGVSSWFEFACEIIRLGGVSATVTPCTTEEYGSATRRPAFSALEKRALAATVGNHMRPWQEALECFFDNYKEENA